MLTIFDIILYLIRGLTESVVDYCVDKFAESVYRFCINHFPGLQINGQGVAQGGDQGADQGNAQEGNGQENGQVMAELIEEELQEVQQTCRNIAWRIVLYLIKFCLLGHFFDASRASLRDILQFCVLELLSNTVYFMWKAMDTNTLQINLWRIFTIDQQTIRDWCANIYLLVFYTPAVWRPLSQTVGLSCGDF